MWSSTKENEKTPCSLQEKTYMECLERYNFNTGICRGEIFWLKYCGEFEQWIEQTVLEKMKAKEAKAKSTNIK